MSEGTNPLSATEARSLTDELKELEGRVSRSGFDPMKALLAAQMKAAGWEIIRAPLFSPSGHLIFRSPEGRTISFSELMEEARWQMLSVAQCASCNASLGRLVMEQDYSGRTRGPRLDRAYCSNACRQKAYRSRKAPGK